MTAAEAISRARSSLNHGCKYELGKGGMKPEAPYPWDVNLECDCSGAAMWFLGRSRVDHGLWMNTDAIAADANNPGGLFDIVPQDPAAEQATWVCAPGDLIVFPKQVRTGYGHVGLVVSGNTLLSCRVIHCSAGNGMKPDISGRQDAIRETSSLVWRGRAGLVFARPNFYQAVNPT